MERTIEDDASAVQLKPREVVAEDQSWVVFKLPSQSAYLLRSSVSAEEMPQLLVVCSEDFITRCNLSFLISLSHFFL